MEYGNVDSIMYVICYADHRYYADIKMDNKTSLCFILISLSWIRKVSEEFFYKELSLLMIILHKEPKSLKMEILKGTELCITEISKV